MKPLLRVPYVPTPAVAWLCDNVRPTARVFEFGCGGSTLWFADHVASLTSVDNDEFWMRRVRAELKRAPGKADVTLIYAPDLTAYAEHITGRGPFDVVFVDGRVRDECIRRAIAELATDGVLVMDNTDAGKYRSAVLRVPAHWRATRFHGQGINPATHLPRKHGEWEATVWHPA